MFAIWVAMRVKPDRTEDFLQAVEEDGRGSREDEPGCLRFDVLQSQEDPQQYFFYEVYRDEAALATHRTMPHYQGWAKFVESGGLEAPPTITRTSTVFPTDDAWKK